MPHFAGLSNVLLGAIAGATIFLGLPVAMWKGASEQLKAALTFVAVGILLFLIIEMGSNAFEIVESSGKSGLYLSIILHLGIVVLGLFSSMVGLASIEQERAKKRAQGADPVEIATMIAIGIGLHNLAEGLAIGQLFSGGRTGLGIVIVIGFALHNATEGFGIAGPLVGCEVSWKRLALLGLIAGAPTALGTLLGGIVVSEELELLFMSLAVGSLIYVCRELLRLQFESFTTSQTMSAICIGLLLGIGSELFVEIASEQDMHASSVPVTTMRVRFEHDEAEPSSVEIAKGENLMLINETNKGLEFDGHGLIVGDAFVPPRSRLLVKIVGKEGQYVLSPTGDRGSTVRVNVLPGETAPLQDIIQVVAALTILEGHVRAAHDLHERGLAKESPYPSLDFKRAGKHAQHPMHESLSNAGGRTSRLVQKVLEQNKLLVPLREKLEKYIVLAGDQSAPADTFEKAYQDLLSFVEQARRTISGEAYNTPYLKKAAIRLVLSSAENEYREATERGKLEVLEPAVLGKDPYLEYQDARGYLGACRHLLGKDYDRLLSPDAKAAYSNLEEKQFSAVDPVDPEHPTPFWVIEKLIERIENGLS